MEKAENILLVLRVQIVQKEKVTDELMEVNR